MVPPPTTPETTRRSVALLAKLCAALVAATRRKKRPAKFKPRQFAKYVEDAAPDSPKANGVNAAPKALLARVLATAIAQDGRELLFAGCSLETYEPTTFYAKERGARLARLVSAVLDPAPRGDASFEWGSDDETRLGWRFRPAFAAPLPSDLRCRPARNTSLRDGRTPRGAVVGRAPRGAGAGRRAGRAPRGAVGSFHRTGRRTFGGSTKTAQARTSRRRAAS